MLYGAHNEAVACEGAAQLRVDARRAEQAVREHDYRQLLRHLRGVIVMRIVFMDASPRWHERRPIEREQADAVDESHDKAGKEPGKGWRESRDARPAERVYPDGRVHPARAVVLARFLPFDQCRIIERERRRF